MSFPEHSCISECHQPGTLQQAECVPSGTNQCNAQAIERHDPAPQGSELTSSSSGQMATENICDRLIRARSQVTELRDCAQSCSRSDEAACAANLLNLLEIAECWAADADDARQLQVATLLDFSEAGLLSLQEAMADQSSDAGRLGQIQSEAQRRWGEYLRLLDTAESPAPELATNPWRQLLSPADSEPASIMTPPVPVEPDVKQSHQDVTQILNALAAASASISTKPHARTDVGKSPFPAASIAPPIDSSDAQGSPTRRCVPPTPPLPTRLEIDSELRSAYVEDAERGVALIEQTLLDLETDPTNAESLHQLCRALHTLKGASASVGLAELARYLHELEDFVELSGTRAHEGLDIQPMLQGVDAVRAQMRSIVVPGHHSPSPSARQSDSAGHPEPALLHPNAPTAPLSVVSHPIPTRPSEESIRVEATRLDRLMDLLGELVISRNRRDTQVGRLKQLHTELMRTAGRLRMLGEGFSSIAAIDPTSRNAADLHRIPDSDGASNSNHSYMGGEIVNDIAEIARSLRELYEPILDENLATSRLMGQFRHELMELRRLPLSGLFLRLQRAARDAAHSEGKQVQFELRGEHAGLEPSLQERLYEPLLHLVRNAVSHGIESEADRLAASKPPIGTVAIETRGDPTSFVIEVRDDGKGLDYDAIQRRGLELGLLESDRPASRWQLAQLMFHPGFSTRHEVTEVSGRGVGLDVVANVIDRLRGHIEVESSPGQGTSVRLRIPLRSSIEHTMVFRVDGHLFALPMQFVQAAKPTGHGHQAFSAARSGHHASGTGIPTFTDVSRVDLPFIRVRDLLSLDCTPRPSEEHSLIVSHGTVPLTRPTEATSAGAVPASPQAGGRIALMVDAVVGPEEVVVRSLPALFKRHRLLAGVTLSGAREIVLLLDGRELIERAVAHAATSATCAQPRGSQADEHRASAPLKVLVVDDSVSVRRSLSRILERRGFIVSEAADGLEALDLLRTFTFSLVITDLEMPRLGGMELLAEIRRTRRTRPLTVAVVSSVTSQEMQERARELGANGYITKPVTDATVTQLLASVRLDGASELVREESL
jgi:chemotaxis protein histidine kinase CheA